MAGKDRDKEKKGTRQDGEAYAPESTKKRPFPVVGIGASAGGLEALEAFFEALPQESGLAFVVITHTDPEHESILPELIKRKVRVDVKKISDGMLAAPDTIYLPPSNRDPVLEQEVFSLKKRPSRPEMHMPVDLFLKHLAQDRGEYAAAVILSGTGTDGSQGIRQIKENAGLTVVQRPETARHAGMPESAIETGLVDYVLAPPEMPSRLIQYFKNPVAIQHKPKETPGKELPDALRQILAFLANRTRHDFSDYKENTLIRRVERRMTITRSRNASAYLEFLHKDASEVRLLFQDLLIGVTNFFRDPEAFSFLRQEVLPALVSRSDQEPFRAWIPGCATGEEAYSIAILLQECLEEQDAPRDLQVFGTDIDPVAIEKARLGTYVQNIVSDVSPDRLKRFFVKQDSHYRVRSGIRELVVFAEQNVLTDPPFSRLDLLVCRNLLIYLKPEAQNRLIPLFHYSLQNEGVLFLGSAEGIGRFHDLFLSLSKPHNIYRKKDQVARPQIQFPPSKRFQRFVEAPADTKEPERRETNIPGAVERLLLEHHTPACVVVNTGGEILHFHGRTGKYLEPPSGEPTVQIADMAREGLRFPLLYALRRVNDENPEIHEKDVQVKTNHAYERIELVVKHLSEPPLRNCRLVVFADQSGPPESRVKAGDLESPLDADGKAAETEHELMRVRQDYRSAMEELQTSNEELRSANEELHSSNEELQSTNEELESSREELQSLNEELHTVNSELSSKMEELKEAYQAINAVLNNTRIAILFLDNHLRLRRFTPETTQLLNLIDSDIGRPLDHVTHNLEYNDLAEKARWVLGTLSSIDEEVRSTEGHWYRMNMMVYRPKEHVIEGVVLTFVNIDAQKKAQMELQAGGSEALSSARQFTENIVESSREALVVLDDHLQVIMANGSFYKLLRSHPVESEGKALFELGDHAWDIPEFRQLLQKIIKEGPSVEEYTLEHRFPHIGFRRLMLKARMLPQEGQGKGTIMLAIDDVTDNSPHSMEEGD